MLNLNHKKLEVWKLSINLIVEIYNLTRSFPKEELFGITNQLRRASVSVTSNIAEGASRKSRTERKRFYEIARSSLVEIDTQLEISFVLNYVTTNQLEKPGELLNELFAKTTKLLENT